MKKLFVIISSLMFTLLFLGPAYGWHISGKIYCDSGIIGQIDSWDIPLVGVTVRVSGSGGFSDQTTTDSDGYYYIFLPDTPNNYTLTIGPEGLPPGSQIILPTPHPYLFATTVDTVSIDGLNGLISSSTCQAGACWLTAGGVKFDSVLGIKAAQRGPRFSFGGNTFPGCSPTAGDGGQWNFVDHARKLHFQGWRVDQVVCGNVPGIPPGSTSPPTQFNYIEFSGVGTMNGIGGNKVSYDPVYFFVRAEDRNEPGNENALLPDGGDLIDRVFLRVYTNPLDPVGSIIYLLDVDGNAATVDPITITGGNIQIHISSCP